ncbi:hypothetical protein ACS0TY_017428 [Phlomoides rotata]
MALSNGVGVELSTQDILDAQTHVWNHIFNFINSMSLKCAVQLGIPDAIHKHGKPMTVSELVDALPINKAKSRGVFRLMRILVHSKFLDKVKAPENHEEEAYCLTPASRLLIRDGTMTMAPLVLAWLDPLVTDPFQLLSEWFKNDLPSPFFTKMGMTTWEYAGIDKKCNESYNEAMASDARLVASILIKECRHVFEGLKTMVDVGGGTGMVAQGIADAIPGLKCICFELPHCVEGLKDSDNMSYVGGDMFESVPQADAAFLKWNLHMWNYEAGVKLLRKCKEAIAPSKNKGGKVIIVETVVDNQRDDHESTETKYFFDMLLMTRNEGGERTEKEWAKLFLAAGFKSYKITPVLGLRSVIEVFP